MFLGINPEQTSTINIYDLPKRKYVHNIPCVKNLPSFHKNKKILLVHISVE